MSVLVNPGMIRKRALRAHMADGILAAYVGFVLTIIGLLEMSQHYRGGEGMSPTYAPVIVLFPMLLMFFAKRRITSPRIGYVEMKPSKQWPNRVHLVLVSIMAIILFSAVIILQLKQGGGAKPYVGLYFAIFVAGIISTQAVLQEAAWVHVGSVFFLLVFGLLYFLQMYVGLGFVVTGVVLFVTGAIQMTLFVKRNPVLSNEEYKRPGNNE